MHPTQSNLLILNDEADNDRSAIDHFANIEGDISGMNIILEDKAEDVESADFRSDQVVKKKEPSSPNPLRQGGIIMGKIKDSYAMQFRSNEDTQKETI